MSHNNVAQYTLCDIQRPFGFWFPSVRWCPGASLAALNCVAQCFYHMSTALCVKFLRHFARSITCLSRVYQDLPKSITVYQISICEPFTNRFAFQSGIGYHKGYCNAIGRGQPWASVRTVGNRQPGGASIAVRRVGLRHGGPGSRKPHQLVRVRSVGRLLTVCGLSLIHI